MVSVAIPGHGPLRIENLVLDYNGTLAVDGELLNGVRRRLGKLADLLRLHVVTADTFGKARSQLRRLDCRNDTLMLRAAALGIAVIQAEGAAVGAVLEADLVVKNVLDALDLLLHPLRLVAGLRT